MFQNVTARWLWWTQAIIFLLRARLILHFFPHLIYKNEVKRLTRKPIGLTEEQKSGFLFPPLDGVEGLEKLFNSLLYWNVSLP